MKKRTVEKHDIVLVPHQERPASLEVQITGIPQWKQDVYQLVAELTKYRLRNKMTQKDLAEKMHVKQSVIARFEKLGRYPTVEFLYKVAAGLGLEIGFYTKELTMTMGMPGQVVHSSLNTPIPHHKTYSNS